MQAFFMKLAMWVLGGFIARTLVGAGLTLVGYVAFIPLLEYGLDQLNWALGGIAADVLNVLLLGGLGDIITIIGSAMMTKISLLAGLAGLARVSTQGGT